MVAIYYQETAPSWGDVRFPVKARTLRRVAVVLAAILSLGIAAVSGTAGLVWLSGQSHEATVALGGPRVESLMLAPVEARKVTPKAPLRLALGVPSQTVYMPPAPVVAQGPAATETADLLAPARLVPQRIEPTLPATLPLPQVRPAPPPAPASAPPKDVAMVPAPAVAPVVAPPARKPETKPAVAAVQPQPEKPQKGFFESLFGSAKPKASVPTVPDATAIYDIAAAKVYLPGGQSLEAHSGIGRMRDNPDYVNQKNRGPTPPHTYKLVMREAPFHGVEAIRLLPVDGVNRFGRVGLLAHTYMLYGGTSQSNGCVVFREYGKFLAAFKAGEIKRLIVVPSLAEGDAVAEM